MSGIGARAVRSVAWRVSEAAGSGAGILNTAIPAVCAPVWRPAWVRVRVGYRKHLWLFLMLAISGSHSHPTALRAAQTAESPSVKLGAFSVSSPFTPFLRL